MATPLALIDVLPDFGAATASLLAAKPAPSAGFKVLSQESNAVEQRPAPFSEQRPELHIEDKIAAAEAALTARLLAAHEAALAAQKARHEEELEAQNKRLHAETGATISAGLAAMEERLCALATSATARILSHVLSEDLQHRSIEQLEQLVRQALNDPQAMRIQISGAPLLWEALKESLGEKAEQIVFSEAESPDLTLAIDDKLFETRLADWSKSLAGVLS